MCNCVTFVRSYVQAYPLESLSSGLSHTSLRPLCKFSIGESVNFSSTFYVSSNSSVYVNLVTLVQLVCVTLVCVCIRVQAL